MSCISKAAAELVTMLPWDAALVFFYIRLPQFIDAAVRQRPQKYARTSAVKWRKFLRGCIIGIGLLGLFAVLWQNFASCSQ